MTRKPTTRTVEVRPAKAVEVTNEPDYWVAAFKCPWCSGSHYALSQHDREHDLVLSDCRDPERRGFVELHIPPALRERTAP